MGEGPATTIAPLSDYGWMIQDLYALIFWLAVGVFVVVEGALIWAVIRYRARPGDPLPPQVHGNTRLEIAWTIAPALVLFAIAVPTIQTIFAAATPPPEDEVLEVRVIGRQFWWEFEYPQYGLRTANEPHIPVGRPVTFVIESADVIHSFWVPRLGGKQDAVPNNLNFIHLTAEETGEFFGQCAEFCGIQHANMKLRMFVDTPEEFDAWVAQQLTPPAAPQGIGRAGPGVFSGRGCVACHTIAGTPGFGTLGPDLTKYGTRTTLAAGILDNTDENLARWLRDPQEVKPGNLMPDLNLTEEEIRILVAYLQGLQ